MNTKPMRNGLPSSRLLISEFFRISALLQLFRVAFPVILVVFAPVVFRVFGSLEVDCVDRDAEQVCTRAIKQVDGPLNDVALCRSVADDEDRSICQSTQD